VCIEGILRRCKTLKNTFEVLCKLFKIKLINRYDPNEIPEACLKSDLFRRPKYYDLDGGFFDKFIQALSRNGSNDTSTLQ
jgi:hypothetical protein